MRGPPKNILRNSQLKGKSHLSSTLMRVKLVVLNVKHPTTIQCYKCLLFVNPNPTGPSSRDFDRKSERSQPVLTAGGKQALCQRKIQIR